MRLLIAKNILCHVSVTGCWPISAFTPGGQRHQNNIAEAKFVIALSPKQVVYRKILRLSLPHLRNVSTMSWWRKLRDRSAYYEAELVHNRPVRMFEPDFEEADLWFLNAQARAYCQECNVKLSYLYPQQVALIRALFALVPENLHGKLLWEGPH